MTQTLIPTTADVVDWRRICRLSDLESGFGEAALVDGRQVALFRLDDGVHAVGHVDPATGAGVIARGITGSTNCSSASSACLRIRLPLFRPHPRSA